ncbi:hypothetical protein [Spirosoma sp.]|uniref:hypothetical protein n=1 Tax=Spirosoma sp. TaxID=1899569 RepID=UPI00096560AA|nr:hypothetical protein [Spirosoma sp.]MBN8825446.1 hypothetical protein [Spirosoma sp.]OJW74955.1 MAG: hypothetical protein BGO59_05520 [Spirosoma sp. 48-14]
MVEKFILLAQKYPLSLVQHILLILPVCIGLLRWKFLSQELKIITVFFLLYFSKETIALYFVLNRINSLGLENIFSCIQAIVLALMYDKVILSKSKRKSIYIGLAIVLIINIITFKKAEISNIGNTVVRVYMIYIALNFFVWLLEQLKIRNVILYGMFWVSVGVLLYAAGTLFMYLFSEYIFTPKASDELFDIYWGITQIVSIIFCLTTSLGVWVSKYDSENYL